MIQDLKSRRPVQSAKKSIIPKVFSSTTKNKPTTNLLPLFSNLIKPIVSIAKWMFGILRTLFYGVEQRVGRFFFIQTIVLLALLIICANLWTIFSASAQGGSNTFLSSLSIVPAKRGNIYYRNLKFNKTIALTTSEINATITYNPSYLNTNIKKGLIKLNDVVYALSANLNINYKEIENTVKNDIEQSSPAQYAILKKNASQSQGESVVVLQNSNNPLLFINWLQYETVETRQYPEGKTLANTVGYVNQYKKNREESLSLASCRKMVYENEKRSTVSTFSGKKEDGVYTVGEYGLERTFCSELGGLNGREQLFSESRESKDGLVQDGADIYLTIDSTLQAKSEEILAKAIEANTYLGKVPKNGSVLILNLEDNGQLKAGEVLASASWPSADPNANRSDQVKKGGYNNVNVGTPYEPGSVMKPITMASALNEWYNGGTNKLGERTGLNPEWKFTTYGPDGKVYTEKDGNTYAIRNSENQWNYNPRGVDPYAPIPQKDCLYNSINTCFTDVELRISNSEEEIKNNQFYRHDITENYYSQRYGFGKSTLADTFPASAGYIDEFSSKIENTFQYANFSFGQGFTVTPMQLARAYTPVSRLDGKMVEPHLISSIRYDNGTTDYAETSTNPAIAVGKPTSVLNPEASKKMNEYLRYVQQANADLASSIGQSYHYRGVAENYPMGSKTGTAEIFDKTTSAFEDGSCAPDAPVTCNTARGIYNQTYLHMGPIGAVYEGKYPKILVIFKISETQPGLTSNNFALLNIGPWLAQMSEFTLDYLGVPPNL
jgi:cell division protein FtsI/penicillin-binding protein 2